MDKSLRAIACAARKNGVSSEQIAAVINKSRRTVSRWFQKPYRCMKETSEPVKHRRALVKKLMRMRTRSGHLVYPTYPSANDLRSALIAKHGITVSRRTVIRDLHAIGATSLVRPKVPSRRPTDFAARLRFARKYARVARIARRIIFSDESIVVGTETTGRQMWVLQRKELLPRESKSRYNLPSIQVWGAIGFNFKSRLVLFPAFQFDDACASGKRGFRLNKLSYVRRCLATVAQALSGSQRLFQQDGARCHDNEHVRQYLTRKRISFISDWPGYSPDLNCIEHIWGILKQRLGKLAPTDIDDLKRKVLIAWESITQKEINAIVCGYQQRLKNVIKSGGVSGKSS